MIDWFSTLREFLEKTVFNCLTPLAISWLCITFEVTKGLRESMHAESRHQCM